MKHFRTWAFLSALLLHAGLLFFGGLLLFRTHGPARTTVEDVAIEEERKPEQKQEQEKDLDIEKQARPEMAPPELKEDAPPPLDLAALEASLNPAADGGDGDFVARATAALTTRAGGLAAAADADAAIVSITDLDQPPRVIYQPPPEYPAALRRRKLDGAAHVIFVVDTDGRVGAPRVQHSTDPEFNAPALQAVRRWRFEPGKRNGKPVAFKMRIPISFKAR